MVERHEITKQKVPHRRTAVDRTVQRRELQPHAMPRDLDDNIEWALTCLYKPAYGRKPLPSHHSRLCPPPPRRHGNDGSNAIAGKIDMVERLPGRGEVKAMGKIDFLEACRDQIIVLIGKAVKKPVAAAVCSHDGASGAYPL